MSAFLQEHAWVLPVLIFAARVTDVTIGTLRIVFLSRGMKILAPLCGFFEVLIWLMAIGQIMQNLDSWVNYVAYAGGFATGNYVGLWVEGKLAMGLVSLWVITHKDASALIERLRTEDFGVTTVAARGVQGLVRIVIIVTKRRDLPHLIDMLKEHNPKAFITINDIRSVTGGVFTSGRGHIPVAWSSFRRGRKGK